MFLSDRTIKTLIASGVIGVTPFDPAMVQPASIDLKLGNLDLPHGLQLDTVIWSVPPGKFLLGVTAERIRLPNHIAGTVHGKSTWARKGLTIHQTGGHVDPFFDGDLTLELQNVSDKDILIRKGEPICQLVFTYLDMECETPYAGRYQNSTGIVQPRPSVAFQRSLAHSSESGSKWAIALMGPHVHKGACDYPERGCICRDMWTAHDNGLLCSYKHCERCSMLAKDADKLA